MLSDFWSVLKDGEREKTKHKNFSLLQSEKFSDTKIPYFKNHVILQRQNNGSLGKGNTFQDNWRQVGHLNDGNFFCYYSPGESTKFYHKKVILHALENLECDKT